MSPWLRIVGIGEDGLAGLAPSARALVEDADVLIGGARHLAMVEHLTAEKLGWESPLKATVARIEGYRGRAVTVLASGDPMAYGVGVTLMRRFAPEEVVCLPGIGAFSLACARLGWPLAECVTLTAHGRPLDLVRQHLIPGNRLLILSEDGRTPAALATLLREAGFGPSVMIVLSHMGGDRETRLETTAAEGVAGDVPDLNTVAVEVRAAPGTPLFSRVPGLADEAFRHDGQMTKREVRAVTLAALAPVPGGLLWDIGAGCGSVAIEWMRAADRARAIAVERNAERRAMTAENASMLGAPQLRIVAGEAPAALDGLEEPHAVFVGGGLSAAGVMERAWQALASGGRLVANAVTLEGEAVLMAWHRDHGGSLTRLAVSRAEPIGPYEGWRPLMPVTQLALVKP